ncbi:MAG: hypothetical protein ABEJ94_00260 [Halorientalis sp.]
MGRLKLASVVFAFAAVSLAVGTGAFSSVSADRGVEVAVVEDEEALLGIEGGPHAFPNGNEDRELLTVTNRFAQPVTVTVEITDSGDGGVPTLKESDDEKEVVLDAGEDDSIEWKIQCSSQGGKADPQTETWTIDVSATGETVSVETTETVTIQCTGNGKGSSNDTGSSGTSTDQSKHE